VASERLFASAANAIVKSEEKYSDIRSPIRAIE
jgi:hypothetical protein